MSTSGTYLLEACRELVRLDGGGSTLGDVLGATYALKGVRALYPAAHAIGDRVSVVYPPEMREAFAAQHCKDFTGIVTGVEFHPDGVDYRVTGDGDPDYTVVEAAFVHPAPPTDPSALAAWLYARVVPGQTIAETPGRRFVVLAVDMSMDNKRVFLDERNGYAIPQATQHPITRLLNPDGTVLWEAK